MGAGHASGWAGPSTPPGGCGLSNTSLGVGGANRGEVKRRRVSQQSQRKVHGRPRAPPPAGAEGLSAGLRSQREVVSTAHSAGWGGRTPVPAVRQPKPSRNPWRPRAWRCGGVAAALLGPLSAGRLRRPWAWTPSCGAWRRGSCRGHPHCCLQADSLRILLLAEQALRAGLEAPLARRSALDLALSGAGSVPFTHTALGRPRLCPFWPASSSGTCPRRGGQVRADEGPGPTPPEPAHSPGMTPPAPPRSGL